MILFFFGSVVFESVVMRSNSRRNRFFPTYFGITQRLRQKVNSIEMGEISKKKLRILGKENFMKERKEINI